MAINKLYHLTNVYLHLISAVDIEVFFALELWLEPCGVDELCVVGTTEDVSIAVVVFEYSAVVDATFVVVDVLVAMVLVELAMMVVSCRVTVAFEISPHPLL